METLECSTGENGFGSTNISWVICRFSAVQNCRVTRLDYCGVMVMWDLRGGKSVQSKGWEKPFWKRWCSSWMFCVAVGRKKDVTLCARVTLAMVVSQAQLPRGLLRRSRGCCSPDSCVAQWVMDGCWSFFVGVKFILRQMTTFLIKEELRIWEGRITNRIANSHELQERGCFCWREWRRVIDFGVQIVFLSDDWGWRLSVTLGNELLLYPQALCFWWNLLQVICWGWACTLPCSTLSSPIIPFPQIVTFVRL